MEDFTRFKSFEEYCRYKGVSARVAILDVLSAISELSKKIGEEEK